MNYLVSHMFNFNLIKSLEIINILSFFIISVLAKILFLEKD